MTLKETAQKEMEELRTLRDRLKVKAHLGKADFKDQLDRIEARWPDVELKLKELERDAENAGEKVAKAARTLIEDVKKSYEALLERKD